MAEHVPANDTTVAPPREQRPGAQLIRASSEPETARDLIEIIATTAHKRLRMMAAIGAGAFGVGTILSVTVPALVEQPHAVNRSMTALSVALTLLSLTVWRWARAHHRPPRAIILGGLIYVTACAIAMAITEVILHLTRDQRYDGVSGMCIWIVLFPMIIPCLPRQALVTALACATSLPVSFAVAYQLQLVDLPPTDYLVDWFAPLFFCAGLAFAVSLGVNRFTTALAETRQRVRELGSYRLEERLGSGGMGEVWRARHRLLPRAAAVKFIKPFTDATADPAQVNDLTERFEREAQAIALLESPHTIQLYDYGMNENGDLYYAMEMLNGLDLQQLVEQHGQQEQSRVIHIIDHLCASLAEAHSKGLIHRDIKPGNIMLCRQAELHDVVKVLDFGLVGAMQQAAGEMFAPSDGQSGITGTPGYIAPELIFGAQQPEPSSDLYAVGAVAFWLLTGRTVFPNKDGGEDLVAHSMDTPTAPSELSKQSVSPELDALILALLAKKPGQRPADANAVRRELAALPDAHTWTNERAVAWWTEHSSENG